MFVLLLLLNFIIGRLPHKHKIVIAGNHELSFDGAFTKAHGGGESPASRIPTLGLPRDAIAEAVRTPNTKQYLTNCTYIEDEAIVIYGIKIYGTPWLVSQSYCNKSTACLEKEKKNQQYCSFCTLKDVKPYLSAGNQSFAIGHSTYPVESHASLNGTVFLKIPMS